MSHNDRPYPKPTNSFLMHQRWNDLLFAHWKVDPQIMRQVVPKELELDLYDGVAWIGVVPFWMNNVRPRFCPPIPILSKFAELNVRTYVIRNHKPGVYFFSLDAESKLAVKVARATYFLPYFHAKMQVKSDGDRIDYLSDRMDARSKIAKLKINYQPKGKVFYSAKGSLEYFLTERYCLYTLDQSRQVWRCEIDHPRWSLQLAEADFQENTMTKEIGLSLEGPPLLHFSKRLDVKVWKLTKG